MVPVWHPAHWNWTFRAWQMLLYRSLPMIFVLQTRVSVPNISIVQIFLSFFLWGANTLFSVFLSSPSRDGLVGINHVKLFLEMNIVMQIVAWKRAQTCAVQVQTELPEISCNAFLNTRRVCRTGQVCCIYWYKLLETKGWILACQMAVEPFLSVTNSSLDLNYFCLACPSPFSTCWSP